MDEQQQDNYGPDWQQQMDAEQERYEMNKAALDRCAKAGVKPEDLIFLARECGLTSYKPPH